VHVVEHSSDSLDDESSKVLTAKFVWPSKSLTCDALKLTHKKWQDDIKYTFDVAKCDNIFDELHKGGDIKLSHIVLPFEELKRQAYCKWHNSYFHAINDCNVFHRHVQLTINEVQLSLKKMHIDRSMFLINKLDLENPAVLIRPEQANTTKGKNVVIGDPSPEEDAKSTPSRKVVMEKLPDVEETITITIRGSAIGNHERKTEGSNLTHNDGKQKLTAADQEQAVRPPWQARSGYTKPWSNRSQIRSDRV
jgi:hypothetical protein